MSGRGRAPPRKQGGGGNAPRPEPAPLVCQADDCGVSLYGCRAYAVRYRVCEAHLAADCVQVGGVDSRFCQQCGRFQHITEFDGPKRSCRVRLAHHNTIRKQRRRAAAAAAQPDASLLSRSSRPSAGRQPGTFERLLNPAEPGSPSADTAAADEPDEAGGGEEAGAVHRPAHTQAGAPHVHSHVLLSAAAGGTVPPLWRPPPQQPPQQPPQPQPVSALWQRLQVLQANTAQAASEAAAEAAAGVYSLHSPAGQQLHLPPVVGSPRSLAPGSQASSSPESARTAVWGRAGSVSSSTLLLSGHSRPAAASPYRQAQQQQAACSSSSPPANLAHGSMAEFSPAPIPLAAAGWRPALLPPSAAAVGEFVSRHWQQEQPGAGASRGVALLNEAVRILAYERRAEAFAQQHQQEQLAGSLAAHRHAGAGITWDQQQQHYPPPDYGRAHAGARAAAAEGVRCITTDTGSARGSHRSMLSHSAAGPAVGSHMGRAATVQDTCWLDDQDPSLVQRCLSLPIGGLQPAAAYGGGGGDVQCFWSSAAGYSWPDRDCSTAAVSATAAAAAAPYSPPALLPARRPASEMLPPLFYSPSPPAPAAAGALPLPPPQHQRSSSVPAQYLMGLSEAAAAVLSGGGAPGPSSAGQHMLQSPPGAAAGPSAFAAASLAGWSPPQQLRSPLMSAGSEVVAFLQGPLPHAASAGAALEAAASAPPPAPPATKQDGLTAAACLADIDSDSNEASVEEDVHALMAWAAGGAGMEE